MLLATSTFAISRPAVDGDPYETAAVTSIATGVAEAHARGPGGHARGGRRGERERCEGDVALDVAR